MFHSGCLFSCPSFGSCLCESYHTDSKAPSRSLLQSAVMAAGADWSAAICSVCGKHCILGCYTTLTIEVSLPDARWYFPVEAGGVLSDV